MKGDRTMYQENLERKFNTNLMRGLDATEVKKRQALGKNELKGEPKKTLFAKLKDQLKDPMIYILMAAAIISMVIGEAIDALIILVVIILNAAIGIAQENKAQKSLEALQKMASPMTVVKRNGVLETVNVSDLVVGDVVSLEAGRYIPADLYLTTTANLKIDESALTGESVPVEKEAKEINEDTPLAERVNQAFMSTFVTYGRGEGIVGAIGMDTQIGKIAKMLDKEDNRLTPLQLKLAALSKQLGKLCVGICVLMFIVGLLQGRDAMEMLITSISLAVAIIPEGLTAVVTIVLALGVEKMAKRQSIVKKLPAVETLGSVNVICSDKTGTITQNKMTVKMFYMNGILDEIDKLEQEEHRLLIEGMMLCNDASNEDSLTGDPTEIALLDMGSQLQLSKKALDQAYPRFDELPFDSDRKLMSTAHHINGEKIVYTKGALDCLLEHCDFAYINHEKVAIDTVLAEISEASKLMAQKAMRVLALAYRKYQKDAPMESDLCFIGLVGMIDPARTEVKEAIQVAKGAGIRTVMITGDHQDTALAIAQEVGIADDASQVMNGQTLSTMTQEDLNTTIDKYRVFARVQPEHKVMVVQALQSKGYVVSMTGDGVNDAPSLKAADIGVAMGITGSDVSKEAGDMILADDNFATIVTAVKEGRGIFQNIKKAILFLLSCNIGEAVALFTAIVLNWATPLRAIHILWVNLITDTLPALALGVDGDDGDLMKMKPQPRDQSIFADGGTFFVIANGLFIGLITLVSFYYGTHHYPESLQHAQTMAFMVLSISQLFHAFNLHSLKHSIFTTGVFKNKYLLGAFVLGLALQMVVAIVPLISSIFDTFLLSVRDWIFVFGISMTTIIFNEILKLFHRKRV
jgi:ATPase, P-type (transporting), HAD superfamily, subfamily IC/ATPase, P-type (transporting), HAD superfamily, subfamily IC